MTKCPLNSALECKECRFYLDEPNWSFPSCLILQGVRALQETRELLQEEKHAH